MCASVFICVSLSNFMISFNEPVKNLKLTIGSRASQSNHKRLRFGPFVCLFLLFMTNFISRPSFVLFKTSPLKKKHPFGHRLRGQI